MQKTKPILLILFCLYSCLHAIAQTVPNLPAVIPPSPAVANFNRYGEIPVDYSTGVPSISVPIYTVKSRQLELPISLSYHASGIKVSDRASLVGLGWVLNAGGYIGATRMGDGGENGLYPLLTFHNSAEFERKRDSVAALQPPSSSINSDGVLALTPFSLFGQSIENQKSSLPTGWQSNKYNFQLPNGESGTFRYDFATGQMFVLPYSNIKVERCAGYAGTGAIKITDEKGVVYNFTWPTAYNPAVHNSVNWNLTSIISADGTDTIRLVYKSVYNTYWNQNFTSSIEYGRYDSYNTFLGNNWGSFNLYNYNNASASPPTVSLESILDSVVTTNSVVKLTVVNDRLDVGLSTDPYRLSKISVYSRQTGNLLKSFTLDNNHYFGTGANNKRLKLVGMSISGSDLAAVENYGFSYDETHELPAIPGDDGLPIKFNEDYWGYNNGSNSLSLVPIQFVTNPLNEADFGGPVNLIAANTTDRTPNPTLAHAAMLQEIDYPTGGKTVFTFEPNMAYLGYWYSTAPGGDAVGGFRIKSIQNYSDNTTLADYKTYEYSPGMTRTIAPELYSATYRVIDAGYYIENNRHVASSSPFLPLTIDNGPPVFYSSVTEYVGNSSTNTGKTVYNYVTPPAMPPAKFITPHDLPYYRDAGEMDRGNYVPHLDSKIIYKYSGGSYIPVQKVQNTYSNYLSSKVFYTGIHPTITTLYEGSSLWSVDYWWCGIAVGGGLICWDASATAQYPYYYYWTDLHATQESSLLTQTINYAYSPDGSQQLAQTTNYTYGNAVSGASVVHTQPTLKSMSSSTGDIYNTYFYYTSDFLPAAPYNTMLTRNMISPLIQQNDYKNSTFLSAVKTEYAQFDPNVIAPHDVITQTGSNSPETRIYYSAYDNKGNIQSVAKATGPSTSYIWGYHQSYPVAQVNNALQNDIFFDSFEEGDGNTSSGNSKTGHYSFNGTYSHSLSGLSGGSYILSYWLKSGSTWSMQISTVSAGTSYTINIPFGQIDDVRFYPSTAQMVTFTFDPLIGMTSSTDAKGEITYYEYDAFSRLRAIRDKDNNITKSFCYNYAGQSVNCFVPSLSGSSVVYARLEYDNSNFSFAPNFQGGYDYTDTSDLYIRFYSDAACTTPLTLTSSMVVPVSDNGTLWNDMTASYSYTSGTNTYTVLSGVSSYFIGTQTTSYEHTFYDSFGNFWDNLDSWAYSLVTSSGYTIEF